MVGVAWGGWPGVGGLVALGHGGDLVGLVEGAWAAETQTSARPRSPRHPFSCQVLPGPCGQLGRRCDRGPFHWAGWLAYKRTNHKLAIRRTQDLQWAA
jgi:hypothetical protein